VLWAVLAHCHPVPPAEKLFATSMRYWPYPDFACRVPSSKQASVLMNPMRMATSSMQAMRIPCRCSRTCT
jgi:hypothetical protein